MYVVPLETVLRMTSLRPHEELKEEGLLVNFDPGKGKAMFVSHQWTTEDHPDPLGKQLEVFQGAMSNLLSGRIVAQKSIWTEVTCHLVGEQAQGFVASTLTENAIQVWYDYFCVPQRIAGRVSSRVSRSLSQNDFEAQRDAIGSIPAYINKCEYFVALCPPMNDRMGSSLNLQSWQQRGWCRAEAVVRDLSEKNGLTLIIESTKQVSLSDSHSMLKAPGEGDFTVPEDRKVVGELVKEFVQQKLWEALKMKDFCKYRFLLNQQVVLLRNSNTEPHPGFLTSDVENGLESTSWQVVQKFLVENGFEKVLQRDRAGWSPLLYAALRGNPKLVEALLVHRADPNDSIRKVQKSITFVKGTPAVSICATQHNNEAMKVLLHYKANPNKPDHGGHHALFFVCNSDNVEGAKILVDAGVDRSVSTLLGTTAFDHACSSGANKILREVLASPPHDWSRQEGIGLACTFGRADPETISLLLDMGCDKDGVFAARNFATKVFLTVLEWSHRMSPTSLTTFLIDSKGSTPLMRSIYTGSYSLAQSLLEAQARVDVRNKNGLTAFDLAVNKGVPDSLLHHLWRCGALTHASPASVSWYWAHARMESPGASLYLMDSDASPISPVEKVVEGLEEYLEDFDEPLTSLHF